MRDRRRSPSPNSGSRHGLPPALLFTQSFSTAAIGVREWPLFCAKRRSQVAAAKDAVAKMVATAMGIYLNRPIDAKALRQPC
jgi:hypothetical protein